MCVHQHQIPPTPSHMPSLTIRMHRVGLPSASLVAPIT
jgi:hypothetical protein